jgi:alpha-glucan,water dikinase
LPDWINLPAQVALPFCTFDAVLAHPNNGHVGQSLQGLRRELEHLDFSDQVAFQDLLGRIRSCIMQMVPTPELVDEMARSFAAERLPWPQGNFGPAGAGGDGAAAQAWAAITGVWASKYNERAVLSCRKAGLSHENVSMAVLCQPVVQSQYAFVLHTTNPQTGNPDEIYGEIVCGMGEALVGNFPGRALSFVARKDDLTNAKVTGFPSKANGLVHRRSDAHLPIGLQRRRSRGFRGCGSLRLDPDARGGASTGGLLEGSHRERRDVPRAGARGHRARRARD